VLLFYLETGGPGLENRVSSMPKPGFFDFFFTTLPGRQANIYMCVCVRAQDNNRRVSSADDVDTLKRRVYIYTHNTYIGSVRMCMYYVAWMYVHTCASLTIYPPRVRATTVCVKNASQLIEGSIFEFVELLPLKSPPLAQMLLRDPTSAHMINKENKKKWKYFRV